MRLRLSFENRHCFPYGAHLTEAARCTGDVEVDVLSFPDLAGFAQSMQDVGVMVMLSTYSHMVANRSANFHRYQEQQLLCSTAPPRRAALAIQPGSFLVDVFNSNASALMAQILSGGACSGLKPCHLWLDGDEGPPPEAWLGGGRWPATLVGAQYPSRLSLAIVDAMPGSVALTRSTWAGGQRSGAVVWCGDRDSTFETLQLLFRTGLNAAMSAIPYWTTGKPTISTILRV